MLKRLFVGLLFGAVALAQTSVKIPSTSSDNTWTGVNTFSGKVTVQAPVDTTDAAQDGLVVHKAGTETIAGAKTFSAGLIAGDLVGTCTNTTTSKLILDTNGKAICSTDATSAVADNSVTTTKVTAGVNTRSSKVTIFDPVATDSGRVLILDEGKNVTITRVFCQVKAATSVVINLNKRTEAAIDTTGTNVLSADLTCGTGGQSSCSSGCGVNTISSGAVAAHIPVLLTFTSVTGTPDTLRVAVEYTVDAAQ